MSVDPRGLRFAAALTSIVLAAVLLTGSLWLLAAQTAVFAAAAVLGVQASPYGWLYRAVVRPRLRPPTEVEDPRPPRFAQAVGLAFALTGLVALIGGASTVGMAAVGLALGAAFLNAAFGLCLGCEAYLLLRRLPTLRRPRLAEEVAA